MCRDLWGNLYGDKGYVSEILHDEFAQKESNFITGSRKNMKPKAMKL